MADSYKIDPAFPHVITLPGVTEKTLHAFRKAWVKVHYGTPAASTIILAVEDMAVWKVTPDGIEKVGALSPFMAPEYDYDCPSCGSPANLPCVTDVASPFGHVPHASRVELAKDADPGFLPDEPRLNHDGKPTGHDITHARAVQCPSCPANAGEPCQAPGAPHLERIRYAHGEPYAVDLAAGSNAPLFKADEPVGTASRTGWPRPIVQTVGAEHYDITVTLPEGRARWEDDLRVHSVLVDAEGWEKLVTHGEHPLLVDVKMLLMQCKFDEPLIAWLLRERNCREWGDVAADLVALRDGTPRPDNAHLHAHVALFKLAPAFEDPKRYSMVPKGEPAEPVNDLATAEKVAADYAKRETK